MPDVPDVINHPDQGNGSYSEGNASTNLSIFQLADNAYVQQSFCSGDPSVVRALEILSILKSHYDRTQYNKNYLAHALLRFINTHPATDNKKLRELKHLLHAESKKASKAKSSKAKVDVEVKEGGVKHEKA